MENKNTTLEKYCDSDELEIFEVMSAHPYLLGAISMPFSYWKMAAFEYALSKKYKYIQYNISILEGVMRIEINKMTYINGKQIGYL